MATISVHFHDAHASSRQGWAVLLAFLGLTAGGIVLYLARLWQAAP